MTDGNWTVGVDGFAGELHGMRDSVESHEHLVVRVRARKKRRTMEEEEGGEGRGMSRIKGNLVEEGSEDGGRVEW